MRFSRTTLLIGVLIFMITMSVQAVEQTKTAIFAGGCFWCMEPPFAGMPGVISVSSGYTGGRTADPTYEQVSTGETGHAEAIKIVYDPNKITYKQLLDVYWRNIDPSVDNRQFCDIGDQYRTAIFVADAEQRKIAEESKQELIDSGKFAHVYTSIEEASEFYLAEEYHQDYANKNPVSYEMYRFSCGRDNRLQDLWGE